MVPDPVYLANVSGAFLEALREAQALAAVGEYGAPLADVLRHARELHEIMVEELASARRATGEYAGGLLLELGERMAALEQFLADKRDHRAP
ncbi:MAG: hypothetical protein ABI593_02410 [Betaproteobacteria bacterium]